MSEVIYCRLCGSFIPFKRRFLSDRRRYFDTDGCCRTFHKDGVN